MGEQANGSIAIMGCRQLDMAVRPTDLCLPLRALSFNSVTKNADDEHRGHDAENAER